MRQEISQSRPGQAALAAPGRLLSGGLGRWFGLSLLFLVAAIVQTWPLILHADNSTVDWFQFPFDTWQFLWNLWWVKHAIIDLQTNPLHTEVLLSPQGSNLYLHALTPVNGVLSIPLQLATNNLILSWNILALLLFVASGLGMYALSYRVTQNHVAALLSGYIFAFAPFTLMHFTGHWNISTTWPIPLFILFLLRFRETGRLREAAAAGIFWAILTYNWLEFAVDAALFLGLFLTYWSFVYLRKRELARLALLWRGFAVAVAVWFVVSSPLIVPGLQDVSSGEYLQPGGDEYFSGDLLTFVTPSPLWGPGTAFTFPQGAHLDVGSEEGTAYLGIVPLLLAGLSVFAVRRTPHRVLFWAMVFLVFAILSLGPYLYVGGSKTLSVLGVSFSVPLPYRIYDQLPIFGERRIPARMIMFGIVGLSVLAGTGLDLLTGWLKPKYGKIVPLAALLVFGLVALEYWNPPVFLSELSTPAILEEIRDEPGDFAVLNAPLGRRNGYSFTGDSTGGPMTNYYQTIYEKRSFGGYLSRVSDRGFSWIMEQPGFAFLSCPHCEDLPSQGGRDPDLVRSLFRQYQIRYVVLHKLDPRGQAIFFIGESELTAMDEYLRGTVDLTPIYEDSALTVYRNPEVGQDG